MNNIYVGMEKEIITPPRRCSLAGQFEVRISEYVESDLYVNVFLLTTGNEQLLICSFDLVGIADELTDAVKKAVKKKIPAICVEKMILAATHVHTGPVISVSGVAHRTIKNYTDIPIDDPVIPEDVITPEETIQFIAEKTADAVFKAYENRKKAILAPAFAREAVAHQRRSIYLGGNAYMYGETNTAVFDAMEAGTDTGVELLYVFDENKKPIGLIANVACPAQVVEMATFVSADYWGKVRERMEEALGEDFVTVGLCSAAGDLSPRDMVRYVPRGGEEYVKHRHLRRADANMYQEEGIHEIGERLSDCFLRKLSKLNGPYWETAELKNEVFELELPIRKVSLTEFEQAKKEFANYLRTVKGESLTSKDVENINMPVGIMERFKEQEKRIFFKTTVHIAKLGDIAFASNPFELFHDYGNYIRARSHAAQTFLVQLADGGGAGGYLPTLRAEKGGHYSAYVTSGYVGHEGGALLSNKSVFEINKMFEKTDA